MSIQSNFNRTLSIAGYLFTQTVGNTIEAKRALSSSKATYNTELEKARKELNIPTDRELTETEIEDLRSHPRVAKALEIHEANVSRYAPILGGKRQIDEYFSAIEKRAGNPLDDNFMEKGEMTTTDENEMAEEFWSDFDAEHDYNPMPSEAPSKAEVMADKASSAMEEEQARVRGEVKIDHRKKKREQNRRRNERRKERKKLGGMNNGEQ